MPNETQFILYQLPDEEGVIQVIIKDESLWATQKAMAQLFGVGVPAISKHLKNIFQDRELDEKVVVSKMEITNKDDYCKKCNHQIVSIENVTCRKPRQVHLDKDSVTEKISATAADGKNYQTQFYNLDAIISVGCWRTQRV